METMFYSGWREMVTFSAEGPQPQVLLDGEGLKVVVAGLMPGQLIPPHPESLGIFTILEAETQLAFMATRVAS